MEQLLISLLQNDSNRLAMMEAVKSLDLPDGWIGAGFIRNLVWDYLHDYEGSSLNDVDVIYYDSHNTIEGIDIETRLGELIPTVLWQARNQALMHSRNNDQPYNDIEDAISHWPEKETAVAVRLTPYQSIEILAPFGLTSLFSGELTRNPKRSRKTFERRIAQKQWLIQWPNIIIKKG